MTRFPKNVLGAGCIAASLALAVPACAQGAVPDALAGTVPDNPPSFDPLPAPTLNFYGTPGLIDMPSGEASPDGQFTVGMSYFGGINRTTLSFQFSPRISASFRYSGIQDWNSNGFDTYYDRSFDARFLLLEESRYRPSVTLGLQDFVGTGISAAEYIAATKTFVQPGIGAFTLPGRIKLTAGIGWGRFGSAGSIGAPFGSNRPAFDPSSTGGNLSYDQWFRGPAAPFGGIEWNISDRLGVKAEYSSDAYDQETSQRSVFERKSRLNFGLNYQVSERLRLGAYYLYGSEGGFNLQYQFAPNQPITPMRVPGPQPVLVRPDRNANPAAWTSEWANNTSAPTVLRDTLIPVLARSGLILESLTVAPNSAELRYRNERYLSEAVGVGRASRALAQVMPPSVETFRLVPVSQGVALSTVTVRRSDLEALEFEPDATAGLYAVSAVTDAAPSSPGAVRNDDLYPAFAWSVGPFLRPSYFDPDNPIRYEVGVDLSAQYTIAPGWKLAGRIIHRLGGNVASATRTSNSVLPRVRTDTVLYSRAADTTLDQLYLAHQWKPSADTYARVSAGYLEQMFGGVSAEFLWKPAASRLGLGIEANYVKQRDFDQRLGFRDYSVATGHASAYYDMGKGYHAQLDVGRYLAGDVGATLGVDREFDNGWSVGGFATFTDVSSAQFGEGSFDKGIRFTVPVNWFLGSPSKQAINTVIRPVQRDGGARLDVPDRLYEQVRAAHRGALSSEWVRTWE